MQTGKYKVLLIEDEYVSSHFVKKLLKLKDVEVEVVATGEKGVEKFQENSDYYNLVITDIQLPNMSGVEVINNIRRLNRKIPIVAFSSQMNDIVQKECLEKGAQKTFQKPLDKASLTHIILLILKTRLSDNQLKALSLYNQGYGRKEIADTMNVSEHTIAWYLREIREQFNIQSRNEMIDLEKKLQQWICE